jgi:hypothetical protein
MVWFPDEDCVDDGLVAPGYRRLAHDSSDRSSALHGPRHKNLAFVVVKNELFATAAKRKNRLQRRAHSGGASSNRKGEIACLPQSSR